MNRLFVSAGDALGAGVLIVAGELITSVVIHPGVAGVLAEFGGGTCAMVAPGSRRLPARRLGLWISRGRRGP